MENKRMKVTRRSVAFDYNTAEEIMGILKEFSERYNLPLSEITVDRDYDEYGCVLTFDGYSDETEEEMATRIAQEKLYNETNKQNKIKLYQQLKKELGYE